MTAASPAGGVSSSGGSSSRSSRRAQRGLLMAPSGLGGCWGAVGDARAGAQNAERRAGHSRDPAGGYKGEPRRDSRSRPAGRTRGGHGAGTPPRPPPCPGSARGTDCSRPCRARVAVVPGAPTRGATQAAPPARRPARGQPLGSRPATCLAPRLPSARARTSFLVRYPLCCPGFPSSTYSALQTCSSFALQMSRECLLRCWALWTHRGSKGGAKSRSMY